jgi:hypothetical protein
LGLRLKPTQVRGLSAAHLSHSLTRQAARHMTAKYLYLRKHVFFCLTDAHCVFLDLLHDNYLCACRDDILDLSPRLFGWSSAPPVDRRRPAEQLDSLAAQLLEAGLVTTVTNDTRAAIPTRNDVPRRTLHDGSYFPIWRLQPSDWIKFALASTRAHWCLTHWPLARTVDSIARQTADSRRHQPILDHDKLADLAKRFRTLRNIFPRSYLCLFDSLALLNFLAYHDVTAAWVFGVTSEPFSAHCWVQVDELVVNDPLDRARLFTPIMTV